MKTLQYYYEKDLGWMIEILDDNLLSIYKCCYYTLLKKDKQTILKLVDNLSLKFNINKERIFYGKITNIENN